MQDSPKQSSSARISRRAIAHLLLLGGAFGAAACSTVTPASTAKPAEPTKPEAAATAKPAANAPAPTAVAPAAKPVNLVKARCGLIQNVFENAFLFVGADRGLFKEQGIDPEFVNFSDGAAMSKALLTGEVDIIQSGVQTFAEIEQGAEQKATAFSKPKLSYDLFVKKEITKPEDLIGKNVGVGAPRTQLHLIMLGYLHEKNIDPDKINFVNAGPSTANFQGVVAGKLDAGVAGSDFGVLLKDNPQVAVLESMADALPLWPQVMLPVTLKNIRDNSDMIGATITAYAASYRYALEHKDEVVRYAVEHMSRDQAQSELGWQIDKDKKVIDPNMGVDRAQIDWIQKTNVQVGIQQEIMPFDKVATTEFHERVIKTLGPYNW